MESSRQEMDQMLEDLGRLALSLALCAILLTCMLIGFVLF